MRIREATEETLDHLGLPLGTMRDALLMLAEVTDSPDRPGHLAASTAGLGSAIEYLREMYKPRSPLQDQLDEIRVLRIVRELKKENPDG